MKRAAPPLARLVTGRILFFAALAIMLQSLVVVVGYYLDDASIADKLIRHEAELLAKGVRDIGGRPGYVLGSALMERYAASDTGYFARVTDSAGHILYSNCQDACTGLFLDLVTPPDRWTKQLSPGKPIRATGGVLVQAAGAAVNVQVATVGDPKGLLWQVLGAEMRDHMILPMGLTLLMVLGGTIPSILALLRPIRRAAAAAETLDVTEATGELDPTGMPAEVAGLTISVNRAFERIRELLQTQRLLTSAISHEIRTPLAIVHLELQRIDHPRARKALLDLDHLVHFVTQLTMLARLEGGRTIVTTPIDLGGLVAHVVEQMAPFVYDNGHEIAFAGAATPPVSGNRTLLEDAVRNLIENAVRHTPDGTRITVGVAACQVEVNDNASPPAGLSGLDSEAGHLKPGDGLGIGLKIVRRIMALHGGALHLRHGPQGTEVVLTLQPALS